MSFQSWRNHGARRLPVRKFFDAASYVFSAFLVIASVAAVVKGVTELSPDIAGCPDYMAGWVRLWGTAVGTILVFLGVLFFIVNAAAIAARRKRMHLESLALSLPTPACAVAASAAFLPDGMPYFVLGMANIIVAIGAYAAKKKKGDVRS